MWEICFGFIPDRLWQKFAWTLLRMAATHWVVMPSRTSHQQEAFSRRFLAVTSPFCLPECDKQKLCPEDSRGLPPFYKCFLWAELSFIITLTQGQWLRFYRRLLTQAPSPRQPLVSQQEAISIRSFNQMHGLGSVWQTVTHCHGGEDGHLPPDVAGLAPSVNDEHRQRVSAPLYLTGRNTAGVTRTYGPTFTRLTAGLCYEASLKCVTVSRKK